MRGDLVRIIELVKREKFDAVVVEGYDGVGKGKLLNILSEEFGVIPYRPDYNLWQKYDHRNTDRWKVSGFFWDIYNHFNIHTEKILLFDRGVLSGATYNDDPQILKDYENSLISNMRVLHILVVCNFEDYEKFCKLRNPEISTSKIQEEYSNYLSITHKYQRLLVSSKLEYVLYRNEFEETEADKLSVTCEGCGHYNYGWCRNPRINSKVSSSDRRCEYHTDKETQDIEEVSLI